MIRCVLRETQEKVGRWQCMCNLANTRSEADPLLLCQVLHSTIPLDFLIANRTTEQVRMDAQCTSAN
jgi:hypothetical protein